MPGILILIHAPSVLTNGPSVQSSLSSSFCWLHDIVLPSHDCIVLHWILSLNDTHFVLLVVNA